MITQNVRKRFQQGSSLIELMISSLIGLILLGVIGSVFLSLQKTAREKSLELHLLQALNLTFSVVKEDIQRAGYDGGNGHSLKLSGATDTITISGGSSIGFVYFKEGSIDNENYRNIKYEKRDTRLVMCEQGKVSQTQILTFNAVGSCYSLFDQDIFQVTQFTVSSGTVTNGKNTSALTDIQLGLQTVDGSFSKVETVSIKQRNWQ
ncbi:PilW family protein [Vibrio sp. YIC-376]|uniref:PilW family protein n=1 Tax=Vibrio sp. YIC-376 TaxID=3136162 RepID=UPI00402ADCE0